MWCCQPGNISNHKINSDQDHKARSINCVILRANKKAQELISRSIGNVTPPQRERSLLQHADSGRHIPLLGDGQEGVQSQRSEGSRVTGVGLSGLLGGTVMAQPAGKAGRGPGQAWSGVPWSQNHAMRRQGSGRLFLTVEDGVEGRPGFFSLSWLICQGASVAFTDSEPGPVFL